jgi:hypothetical protein
LAGKKESEAEYNQKLKALKTGNQSLEQLIQHANQQNSKQDLGSKVFNSLKL